MNKSILKIIIIPATLFLVFIFLNDKALASEVTGALSTGISTTVITSGGGGSSGGGGVAHYGCKDPKALNYEYFATSNPSLCKYSNVSTTTTSGGNLGTSSTSVIPETYIYGNKFSIGNPIANGNGTTTGSSTESSFATSTTALGPTQATSTINSLLAAIAASGFPTYNELFGFSILLLIILIILFILWLIKRKAEDSGV